MQIVLLVLGMFMVVPAIIMIVTPLYIPIVKSLGFNPAWFVAVSLELGCIIPPYGLNLLIMKSVAPSDTTMDEILYEVPYLSSEFAWWRLGSSSLFQVWPSGCRG